MTKLYFEEKGAELLERIGMSKAEFARRMGIQRQNVNILFASKNVETIRRAADIIGVPLGIMIGYTSEPDLEDFPVIGQDRDYPLVGNIPTGDSVEDRRNRQKIIQSFYHQWKVHNPDSKRYNINLKDDINIRFVSVKETAGQASLTYHSTLAVLQLDAILTNATLIDEVPSNPRKNNQRPFEKMLRMSYFCPGLGFVKMLVGVKRSDKSKVQYCITAIETNK